MSQRSSVLVDHLNDARDDLAFPLGPAGPSGFSGSCSHRWCASVLGGINSIGSGYVLWGRLPSYLAIRRMARS